MVSVTSIGNTGGIFELLLMAEHTVSPPTLKAPVPVPIVIGRMGERMLRQLAFDSSETNGQAISSTFPAARFMAKARQVGTPHLPQFVLGRKFKNLYSGERHRVSLN